MRSFQIELKLNQEQTTLCAKSAGTARYAFNWALDKCQEEYACSEAIAALAGIQKGEKTGYKRKGAAPRHKDWNVYKKSKPWIYEVSKCCGQEAFRDLDNAYDNIASLNTRNDETLFMFPRYEPLFRYLNFEVLEFRYLNFEVLENPDDKSRKMIRHREDESIVCDSYIDILDLAEKIRGSGKVGEETRSKLDNVLRFSISGYLNVAAYNDFMLKNVELKLAYEGDSDEELEDLLGYRSKYLLSQIPGIYHGGTFDDLELAKMSNLISMCHSLHCLFTPCIYHGQDYDYTMHAKVNKIFSNVITNLMTDRNW